MQHHFVSPWFFGLLGVICACGSEASPPSPRSTCQPGFVCGIEGVPFVDTAVPVTDTWTPGAGPPGPGKTTATITQPEPGKVCMSGHTEAGWAFLTLGFAHWGGKRLSTPLDAAALGVERFEFSVETPPPAGLFVQLLTLVRDCTLDIVNCQHWGFYLSADPGGVNPATSLLAITESGPVSAPLSSFAHTGYSDPRWEFDPSQISALQIGLGVLQPFTSDYAFCIDDFALLNADGDEIASPP